MKITADSCAVFWSRFASGGYASSHGWFTVLRRELLIVNGSTGRQIPPYGRSGTNLALFQLSDCWMGARSCHPPPSRVQVQVLWNARSPLPMTFPDCRSLGSASSSPLTDLAPPLPAGPSPAMDEEGTVLISSVPHFGRLGTPCVQISSTTLTSIA
jgi:hypothetical protein